MPHRIIWNKNKTKVKVWSTIVDAYLTKFMKPEDLVNDPKHRELVLWHVYRICPTCSQKLPDKTNKE